MTDCIRILHVADSHIGADLPQRPRHNRPRRGHDFVNRFEHTIDVGFERHVDLAVHAGDLFDSPRPGANAIAAAAAPLRRLADAGIPVIIVPGNHERTAVSESLLLMHPNIHVVAAPKTIVLTLHDLRVAVSGFPCIRRGVASQFQGALEATGWRDVEADVRMLVVHQTFDTAVCGPNGFRFRSGIDVIDRSAVPAEFDYVAAGHIHRYQKLRPASRLRPHIVYSGSPDRISFAEKDEPKGCVIAEIHPDAVSHTFIEHAVRPMSVHPLAVNGLSSPKILDAIESIVMQLPTDAVAQIRLTGLAGPEALKGLRIVERTHHWRPDAIVTATIRGIEATEPNPNAPSEPADATGAEVTASSGAVFDEREARRIYSTGVGNSGTLPTRRGVYAFFDASQRVLYIGKAANLRARVRSHLNASKGGNFFDGWVRQAVRVDAVLSADDAAATALEGALIQRWRPPFNIAGRITA